MSDQVKKKLAAAIVVAMAAIAGVLKGGVSMPESWHGWLAILLAILGGILSALPAVQGEVPAEKMVASAAATPDIAAPVKVQK